MRDLPQGPDVPHPAIRRGRYEVETFGAGRSGASGRRRTIQPVLIVLRVVDCDADFSVFLESVPRDPETPDDISAEEFIQLVAPFLHGGLLDPGDGENDDGLPPVRMVLKGSDLRLIQVVGCLN